LPEPARNTTSGGGESASLTPQGPTAAEIRSRGYLPLRARDPGEAFRRPAFPGTAVLLGDQTFEVVAERSAPEGVVYLLGPWPEGEVARHRVAYGPPFVRAVLAERERAAIHARLRPYRFVLYPLVGLLPEAEQERWSDRLGLYAVHATLVSGLCEVALYLLLVWGIARGADGGLRVALLLLGPLLGIVALLGVLRAFGAAAFREVSGQVLVEVAFDLFRGLRAAVLPADVSVVPLTRAAFWARLGTPDRVTRDPDGALTFRGLLPHLHWRTGHNVRAGEDYWRVEPQAPVLDRNRVVYSYRLSPAARDEAPSPAEPPGTLAYAEDVLAGVRREWDDLLGGFAWLASLLPEDVQRRAFDPRGGPAAARRPTAVTAVIGLVFAAWVFLQPVVAADPIGPWFRVLAAVLCLDALIRIRRARRGLYAPSLFAFALPSGSLRPERVAYHAHRDAERQTLLDLRGRG
jgi:hypothetical protein